MLYISFSVKTLVYRAEYTGLFYFSRSRSIGEIRLKKLRL